MSWHHITLRDPQGPDLCPNDTPSAVRGAIAEIGAALKWCFGVAGYDGIPKLTNVKELAECQFTWNLPSDVDENVPQSHTVNRLYRSRPNPSASSAEIRFSLARTGRVGLWIYNVNGRLVRTLVDAEFGAGENAVVWDGVNSSGEKASSGIYWVQMETEGYQSSKRLLIMR